MILWIEAQLPPSIALWIRQNFPVEAVALRDLGLRDAEDEEIFHSAKRDRAVIITKDSDFLLLQNRIGGIATNSLAVVWEYLQCSPERNPARCVVRRD